jgi:choice-of-anchor B domain-containing protein
MNPRRTSQLLYVSVVLLNAATALAQQAPSDAYLGQIEPLGKMFTRVTGQALECERGFAGDFPCNEIDLLSFLPVDELGGPVSGARAMVNDVWGWTDPETGFEYAIVGRPDGTAFVNVTDPIHPDLVGFLPMHEGSRANSWRDIKVYKNYAVIVADGAGAHGLQFFDLSQLRDRSSKATIRFAEASHYAGLGSAHNVVINEETGFAYAVGSSGSAQECRGLHMVDIRDPLNPRYAGCYADFSTGISGTGYTHDAQCVVYRGPDVRYRGREICFGANETAISIADVTDKRSPGRISVARFHDHGYVHQGWLTEDHRYFFVNDEGDERRYDRRTFTMIFDVSRLDMPIMVAQYEHETDAIDHNLYIRGRFCYQANYTAGLRILDIRDPVSPFEVAFFDTTPLNDEVRFAGSWSVYPFFESGNVVVSSINEGLFVLRPTAVGPEIPEVTAVTEVFPNPVESSATFKIATTTADVVSVDVFDAQGRKVRSVYQGLLAGERVHSMSLSVEGLPAGSYFLRIVGSELDATRRITVVR